MLVSESVFGNIYTMPARQCCFFFWYESKFTLVIFGMLLNIKIGLKCSLQSCEFQWYCQFHALPSYFTTAFFLLGLYFSFYDNNKNYAAIFIRFFMSVSLEWKLCRSLSALLSLFEASLHLFLYPFLFARFLSHFCSLFLAFSLPHGRPSLCWYSSEIVSAIIKHDTFRNCIAVTSLECAMGDSM